MGQLIFLFLLWGEFFLFYLGILDIPIKKVKRNYRVLIYFFMIGCICIKIIFDIEPTKIALIMGLVIPVILDDIYKKTYGIFLPLTGMCLSANTLWVFIINRFATTLSSDAKNIICLCISYIIIFLIYTMKRIKGVDFDKIEFSFVEIIILNIYTIFIGVSMGGAELIQEGKGTPEKFEVYIITTTLLCFAAYFMTIKAILLNRKIYEERNKNFYKQVTLDSQKEQIEAILENERKLHAYRHDLNTHLNTLSTLAETEDTKGIKEYCEKLLEGSQVYKKTVISGNTAVDGILGRSKEKCIELGIKLQLDVALIENNKLSDYELCIIFSNMLNNAVEACNKGDIIKLACYPYNEYLCILLQNPINNKMKIDEGLIETTKEDKLAHGHGIRNIKAVVDKYDGRMEIKVENDLFKMEILL